MITIISKLNFLLFSLALCAPMIHAEQAWFKLYGQVEGDSVRLYWDTKEWPKDLEGFHVKRRSSEDPRKVGSWERLTSQVVSPSLSPDRVWSNQGLNQDQANEAARALQEVLELGKASPLNGEETLARLRQENGLKDGDRIRLMQNFFLAVSNGFGYIDNGYEAGKRMEYGLFYVGAKGREKASPIAVFSTNRHLQPLRPDPELNLEAGRAGDRISLSWRYALRNSDSQNMIGFNVYRRPVDGKRFNKLVHGVVGKYKTDKGYLHWRFRDNHADATKSFVYRIAAVDYFQHEFLQKETIYDAEAFRPLQTATITSLAMVEDDHVKLTWKSPREDRPRIAGFVVERAAAEGNYIAVSPRLSNYTWEFIDQMPKDTKTAYAYRIVSIDNYGQFHYSPKKPILYLGQPKPPAPTGLTARFSYVNDQAFIELAWDKKAKDDRLTHGYRLSADATAPGTMLDQAGIPTILDNGYRFRVYRDGRDYTIQLFGVTKAGGRSKPLEVSCYVPVFKVPRVTDFSARVLPKGQVQLAWEYPVFQDLHGFRIYMNDQQIAGEEQASANVRGWLVPEPIRGEGSRSATFSIEAVNPVTVSDRSQQRSLRLTGRIMDYHEAPPEALSAKLAFKDGKSFAKLAWRSQERVEDAGLLGYVLMVDYAEPGVVQRLGSIPLIKEGEVDYPLPSLNREAYTFRVAAMDKSRKIGPYAEVTLKVK